VGDDVLGGIDADTSPIRQLARFAGLVGDARLWVSRTIVSEIAKQLPGFGRRGLQNSGLQASQLLQACGGGEQPGASLYR
jgi:hypothetical protein